MKNVTPQEQGAKDKRKAAGAGRQAPARERYRFGSRSKLGKPSGI
jgi:hypothetical protein